MQMDVYKKFILYIYIYLTFFMRSWGAYALALIILPKGPYTNYERKKLDKLKDSFGVEYSFFILWLFRIRKLICNKYYYYYLYQIKF